MPYTWGFLTFDFWETGDWQVGFGVWDEAFEIYLGKLIVRFSHYPAEFR